MKTIVIYFTAALLCSGCSVAQIDYENPQDFSGVYIWEKKDQSIKLEVFDSGEFKFESGMLHACCWYCRGDIVIENDKLILPCDTISELAKFTTGYMGGDTIFLKIISKNKLKRNSRILKKKEGPFSGYVMVAVNLEGLSMTPSDILSDEGISSFEKGTINKVYTDNFEYRAKNSDGEIETRNDEMTLWDVDGDENASALHRYLSSSEGKEYTDAKIGEKGSGRNIVGTNYEEGYTIVGNYLKAEEYTLRTVNHNHPNRTFPSGSDIRNAANYESAFPGVNLNVYIHNFGYVNYNSQSTVINGNQDLKLFKNAVNSIGRRFL